MNWTEKRILHWIVSFTDALSSYYFARWYRLQTASGVIIFCSIIDSLQMWSLANIPFHFENSIMKKKKFRMLTNRRIRFTKSAMKSFQFQVGRAISHNWFDDWDDKIHVIESYVSSWNDIDRTTHWHYSWSLQCTSLIDFQNEDVVEYHHSIIGFFNVKSHKFIFIRLKADTELSLEICSLQLQSHSTEIKKWLS